MLPFFSIIVEWQRSYLRIPSIQRTPKLQPTLPENEGWGYGLEPHSAGRARTEQTHPVTSRSTAPGRVAQFWLWKDKRKKGKEKTVWWGAGEREAGWRGLSEWEALDWLGPWKVQVPSWRRHEMRREWPIYLDQLLYNLITVFQMLLTQGKNWLCNFRLRKQHWSRIQSGRSSISRSVVLDSLRPHGLWSVRLLWPWDSPGRSTGEDCHSLLQRLFPTQGLNPGLLRCRQILYRLSYTIC